MITCLIISSVNLIWLLNSNIQEADELITKKRYAVLYYDKEGKRVDVAGKEGSMKAMGLDLKRSDTPVFVQDFLGSFLQKKGLYL